MLIFQGVYPKEKHTNKMDKFEGQIRSDNKKWSFAVGDETKLLSFYRDYVISHIIPITQPG